MSWFKMAKQPWEMTEDEFIKHHRTGHISPSAYSDYNLAKELEELQVLVIQQLKRELKEGNTENISVANTLLTANKVVVKHDQGENVHSKVKRMVKK